jgi:hypothetical protein
MVTLHCCGENYYADDQHVGRHIRCTKCGRKLTISATDPISPSLVGQPVAPQATTKVGLRPNATFGTARISTRRLQFLKVALAGILLSGIGVWFAIAKFTHHISPSTEVQTPVATPLETPSTSGDSTLDEIRRSGGQGTPAVGGFPSPIAISLPTGTWIITPRGIRGEGILRIKNGTGLDAAVKLVTAVSPRKTAWMVYIRAGEEKTVAGIGAGTYLLRFALGLDWDASDRKFLRSPEFYEEGKHLDFTEMEPTSDEPGKYAKITLTLNEVPFGNLPREPINEIIFSEGDPIN